MPIRTNDPEPVRTSLSDAQRLAWLRLIRSENIGPSTFQRLINRFGSAVAALEALPEVATRGGSQNPVRAFPEHLAEKEHAILERNGGRMVALCEPGYPELLTHLPGAPPLISVLGTLPEDSTRMVAIVGARNASAAGMAFTRQLASQIGHHGFTIVSGLARGIDGAAHAASLASGTIAVVAGGLGRLYPQQNTDLARAIVDGGGAIISEMPFGISPIARDFPKRNRIVAGMALGVVVVEAAVRSGSLITARMANEQNRDVMAVPGFPLDPRSAGGNKLIREGATLIRNTDDVLEQLAHVRIGQIEQARESDCDTDYIWTDETNPGAAENIIAVLNHTPVPVDEVIRATQLSPQAVQTVLLDLEIAGRIDRTDGQLVNLRLAV